MSDVNMTKVVELVKEQNANLPIQIMHTGGGCMTVYAGTSNNDGFFELAIGPCTIIDGIIYGTRNDLYFGEDGCEDDYIVLNEETEEQIAQMIQDKLVA